ncbi:Nuclear pore complex protein [Halotydeus destructor]|nr:Nuclear pore complex protein [Halotydeus destructor]
MAIGSYSGLGSPGQHSMVQDHTSQHHSAYQMSSTTVESASVLVDKFLQTDSTFPQLHELLKCSPESPSSSGLHDIDYPSLREFSQTMRSVSQISKLTTIPLPTNLREQFSQMQQNCEMGLFPEIGRAWLTVDSNIYLWSYDNAEDVAYYDGLTETIVSVGLIKPKPGVFREHIKYLLCLTTAVEISLLGVTFSSENGPRDFSDLLLLPEAMFSVATDNIVMNCISGSSLGRVFMAGRDGCLYEVVYKAEEGWFSRKCRKINHSTSTLSFFMPSFLSMGSDDYIVQIEVDNSRQILFTRSDKGTIDVYDLGQDGQEMSKVASRSLASIVQQASAIAPTVDSSNFKPIIGMSAIEEQESAVINLLAVTENGVRFYFTSYYHNRASNRPAALNVVHVRLPPGFSASSNQRPSRVHLSHHRRSATFMISSLTEDRDILWVLNNDPFPFSPNLIEVSSALSLNSRVWKMTEEVKPAIVNHLNTVNLIQFNRVVSLEPPVLVTQELEEDRKFVFLSSNGVHIAYKPRPVEHLKQILQDNQGIDNEAVRGFFILFKELQACSIALSLACNNPDKLVSEWATLAFFRYGSESQAHGRRIHQPMSPMTSPQTISSPFKSPPLGGYASTPIHGQSFASPFMSPIQASQQVKSITPTQSFVDPTTEYSNRHNGVFLYFSRIIRSLWNYSVVSAHTVNTPNGPREFLQSSVPSSQLALYITKLSNLRDFLDKNIRFTSSEGLSSFISQNIGGLSVAQQERTSLFNLFHLIKNCLEVLGLWKILQDHQFHTIAENLTADYITQLKSLTFRNMVLGGGDVCARLASALVQKFIDDNATTDAISRRLNEACPSIFKQENALHAKAHETLVKARSVKTKKEQEALVEEAYQLFKKIGGRINLRQACDLLQAVNSYKNLVELCISAAAQRDPQNVALSYFKNNEPAEDYNGRQIYVNRMECYLILLENLEALLQQSQNPVQPKTLAPVAGDLQIHSGGITSLTADEATKYSDFIMDSIVKSKDELLHTALYDWLYQHRMSDRLLQIKSPFLEAYLKRKTTNVTDSVALMDLMWMFYERNGHFRAAAEILSKLAERHGTDIDLYHRLQYLSRAIVSMKSCQNSINVSAFDAKSSGEFLHELEEKMQVASIQLQLLETLQRQSNNQSASEAISRLNSDLLDVTQLYDTADFFRLPEIQLAILSAANHYDPAMIEMFWRKILDQAVREADDQPNDSFKAIISNKIEALGKQYLSSEKYFPSAFIVSYLEERTQPRQLDGSWLAETLINLGIPLPIVVETYHKLYKSRNKNLSWPGKESQLLRVLVFLFTYFTANPSCVSRVDRRSFITKCLDVISGYILDLQSSVDGSERSSLAELRHLQSKLENLH